MYYINCKFPHYLMKNEMIIINLDGPDGNAFSLLSTAKILSKMLELDFNVIEEEMKKTDYTNLIKTFNKYW